METKRAWTKTVADALDELESVSDEIRVKVHLAGMDARTVWDESLEPRLEEARNHARAATVVSNAAIDGAVEALRRLAASL